MPHRHPDRRETDPANRARPTRTGLWLAAGLACALAAARPAVAADSDLPRAQDFRVFVDGREIPVRDANPQGTFQDRPPKLPQVTDPGPLAAFEFTGETAIRIRADKPITAADVRPGRLGIAGEIDGNEAVLRLPPNRRAANRTPKALAAKCGVRRQRRRFSSPMSAADTPSTPRQAWQRRVPKPPRGPRRTGEPRIALQGSRRQMWSAATTPLFFANGGRRHTEHVAASVATPGAEAAPRPTRKLRRCRTPRPRYAR